MIVPSFNTSLESTEAPEKDSSEATRGAHTTTTSVTPLFSTGNVQFIIDKDGNNLSIPAENSPENAAENYHNFKDGYDTEDEISPFGEAVLGEKEVDNDAASLLEVSDATSPLAQPLLVEQTQVAEYNNGDNQNAVPLMEEAIKKMLNSELTVELKK
jgi:hypothetical protein